jgi:hypothetical protein
MLWLKKQTPGVGEPTPGAIPDRSKHARSGMFADQCLYVSVSVAERASPGVAQPLLARMRV